MKIGSVKSIQDRVLYASYLLAPAVSVSIWFIPVRSPLWLDETISFWQIKAGFSGILSRQGLSFPAYSYILWLDTKISLSIRGGRTGCLAARCTSSPASVGFTHEWQSHPADRREIANCLLIGYHNPRRDTTDS